MDRGERTCGGFAVETTQGGCQRGEKRRQLGRQCEKGNAPSAVVVAVLDS